MDFVMLGGAEETQWRRIAKLPVEPFGLCGSIHESMTLWMSQPDISRWPGELFPRLERPVWIDIEQRQNMGGALMYDTTPEDNWNGPRSRK
jgi:hypothetical protein